MRTFRTNSTDVHVKVEMSSGDEFVPDVRQTQMPSIYHLVPDMKIKLEVVDFHRNSTDDFQDHSHLEHDTVPSIPLYVDCDSTNLNQFYSELLHWDGNCVICQRYRMILMQHVRTTHDPLDIEPRSTDHDSPQGDLIQIKCEVAEDIDQKDCSQDVDFQHNSTSDTEDDSYRDLKPASAPKSNIQNDSVKTEQKDKDMNQFNVDFLQWADPEDCETCREYLRMLSQHLRTTHALPQPIRDPLLIDPLNIDPDLHNADKSPMEVKHEVHDEIEKMECSEKESESNDPDFELESGSERVSNYDPSTHMIPNVHRPNLPKNGSNDSTSLKVSETRNKYKCDQCGKYLTTKSNLTVHMRSHTGERPYKCDVCEKSFSAKCRLTDHKRSHTGERPYQCDVCMKCFSTTGNLAGHKRIHTGERSHKCGECEQSFSRSSTLTQHKSIHSGERPFKCDVCEKSFTTSGNLAGHERTHSGERPYKCDACEKSFMDSSNLAKHKRVHSGERPYKCEECGKSFKDTSTLSTHKRIHSRERPYKCNECEMSFIDSRNLANHKGTHWRKPSQV